MPTCLTSWPWANSIQVAGNGLSSFYCIFVLFQIYSCCVFVWIYKDGALLRHSERSAHFFRYLLFPGDTLLYRLSHVEYTHMYTSIVCTHATHFTLFNELLVKSMRATTSPQFFVWPPEGSAHSKILHSVFESLCPSTLNANSKLYKQKQQQQLNKSLSHT